MSWMRPGCSARQGISPGILRCPSSAIELAYHHLLTEEFGAADHQRSSRSIGSSAKRSVHSLTGGWRRLARQVSPGEMQWPKGLAAFWWTPLLKHSLLPEQVPTA